MIPPAHASRGQTATTVCCDNPVRRTPLNLPADPLEVLRQARGGDRLVALVGQWRAGPALLAWNPAQVLSPESIGEISRQGRVRQGGSCSCDTFAGGWIGRFGYQFGGDPARRTTNLPRPVITAPYEVAYYGTVLRQVDGQWWLEQESTARSDELDGAAEFLAVLQDPPDCPDLHVGPFTMSPSPAEHRDAIRQVLEHIEAGDVFQANIATRLDSHWSGHPVDLFCRGVAALRPAYAALVCAEDSSVVSFSPELFLRRDADRVLTSPIKGTAPLSSDPAALMSSSKDRAENVMIVDLMRNDLSRVALPGSVHVPAVTRLERHAVWHLVSDVTAQLRPGIADIDLLAATFPPGSVTGAPKIRAMELIDGIEATARESYTGAIGVLGRRRSELNVAIRTFETSADRIWLGVGGGIVADSDPDAEVEECLVKALPLLDAIGASLLTTTTPGAAARRADDEPAAAEPRPRHTQATESGPDRDAGVFETLLVLDGVPQNLQAHLHRLARSTTELYGSPPPTGLGDEICRRSSSLAGFHRLRVDLSPGPHGQLPHTVTTGPLSQDIPTWTLRPLDLPGGLSAHKWIDRSMLSYQGPGDGRLITDGAQILETDRASIFIVREDGIHTPALDGRILPGTARQRAVEWMRSAGLPVHERPVMLDDLAGASEVFATNALRGAHPVRKVTGYGQWPPGPVATTTAQVLRAAVTSPTHQHQIRPIRAEAADQPGPASAVGARLLIVDNYDSFVHNLARYAEELGASVSVVRNDDVDVDAVRRQAQAGLVTHLLLSPGPGNPVDAGACIDLVRHLGSRLPILGVCLGHQAIVEAYGGRVVRGPVTHGKPAILTHDGLGVHHGLPHLLPAGRYHSLVLDQPTLPEVLRITSRTTGGVPMGVRHNSHPVEGVQWHPESVLTRGGYTVMRNFLAISEPMVCR